MPNDIDLRSASERELLITIIDRLDLLAMTTEADLAAVSDSLTSIAGSVSEINQRTSDTQSAVDALQQWAADHPDIDPQLQALIQQAQSTAQATSEAAAGTDALAQDATANLPGAPAPAPEPTPEPPADTPPADTPPADVPADTTPPADTPPAPVDDGSGTFS